MSLTPPITPLHHYQHLHYVCPHSTLTNITPKEKNAVITSTFSLTLEEKILFQRQIRLHSVIVEFSDGDTLPIYCQQKNTLLRTIIIISENPTIQSLDSSLCSKHHLHFLPYYIEIGKTGEYNSYLMNATMELWPNYVKSMELFQTFQPTLYFINGKLRFATLFFLLLILLEENNNNINNNSKSNSNTPSEGKRSKVIIERIQKKLATVQVIVHDFYEINENQSTTQKPQSKQHPPAARHNVQHPISIILLYYEVIDCIGSLAILKPKSYPELNATEILSDYNKYIKIFL